MEIAGDKTEKISLANTTQKPKCKTLPTETSQMLSQKPKATIASESLAERALHSSQDQLQKLKHYVPREEIARYKELGLQVFDFKRDSAVKKEKGYSISRSQSCSSASSSKSSRSAISLSECQSIKGKKVKGKGSFSKLFPAKSFSSLIKRNETNKQKSKDDKLQKHDKIKLQTRSCQSSPTLSLIHI